MGAGRNVADVRLIPCGHTTDAEYSNKMPAKSLMLADKCPLDVKCLWTNVRKQKLLTRASSFLYTSRFLHGSAAKVDL